MFEEHSGTGRTAFINELAHTADVALQIDAETPADLFAGAAVGMAQLMTGEEEIPEDTTREIELSDSDLEGLLVNWLNSIIEMYDDDGFLPTSVEVRLEPPAQLSATLVGATNMPAHILIKAATFHNLEVGRVPVGWSTTVVFDV